MVDENLENYQRYTAKSLKLLEIIQSFKNLISEVQTDFLYSNEVYQHNFGKVKYGTTDQGPTFFRRNTILLSSKNNPQVEVRFRDLFPIFNRITIRPTNNADVEYLTSSVTFRYTIYDFANVGSSTTQVTTS